MNILIFDTETIGTEKAFCYDIGYVIFNTEEKQVVKKQEFVIEQIWSNKALFETAFYREKKPLYISKMRGRKAKLVKWGYAVDRIIKDIENFEISSAYAYNSKFDMRVIDFNAEWYKTRNFLDYVKTYDIWGYTSKVITSELGNEYRQFCEENNFFSESGNYTNNADTWGKFLKNSLEWQEEHTALEDSKIECEILMYCIDKGLKLNTNYKVCKTIPKPNIEPKILKIRKNGVVTEYEYKKKTEYKKKGWLIDLKD